MNGISVSLRQDQWELIVLTLEHTAGNCEPLVASPYGIDRPCRKAMLRRVKEILGSLEKQVPNSEHANESPSN